MGISGRYFVQPVYIFVRKHVPWPSGFLLSEVTEIPNLRLLLATLASALFLSGLIPSVAAGDGAAADICTRPAGQEAVVNTLDDHPEGQSRPLVAAHFVDPSGSVTAAEIARQPFTQTPCAGPFPISSPDGALWLRFVVANPHDGAVGWVLGFMDTILDEVTLYQQTSTGLLLLAENGRAVPATRQAIPGTKTAVPLALDPGESQQVYMRISGTYAPKITPVLVSANLFERWSTTFGSVSVMLLGFTAMLTVFSILLFRHVSARFYRYYTLFVVSSFLFTFFYDGWFHRFFGLQSPVTTVVPLIQLWAGVCVIANIQYCRVLLSGGKIPRGQKRILQALTTAAALFTGLAVMDPWTFGLSLQLLFFISPVVLFIVAVRRLGQGLVQVVPVCASLLCLISGLTVATYFFIYPVRISQTSSAFDLMMMRPTTISYALAIIGEALFMMMAISAMLNAMRRQSRLAIRETETLRDALTKTEAQTAKMLDTKTAQIEALSGALAQSPKGVVSSQDRFVDRATESVITHVSLETYNAKDLALDLGVSEKTLGRRLKEVCDLTPAAFIRSVRLRFARDLILRQHHKTVSEIAYAAGFSSARHFSKLYRSEFHETPSETLKLLKN